MLLHGCHKVFQAMPCPSECSVFVFGGDLGGDFLGYCTLIFLAMFSSLFRGNDVSHLLVQTSAKDQGCLDWLVFKQNQRSPSFLFGHVRSAYQGIESGKGRGCVTYKNFLGEAVPATHLDSTGAPSSFCSFHHSYPRRTCPRLMLNCCVMGLQSGKLRSAQIFQVCQNWLSPL